jgi:hypothetical protein
MTNDRSSKEDFLRYLIQLKHQSSLVRVSGSIGRLEKFEFDGRVSAISGDSFRVRGRGCEFQIDFSRAIFTRMVPSDSAVVALRPDDPGWIFRPLWRIEWGSKNDIFLEERSATAPPVSL